MVGKFLTFWIQKNANNVNSLFNLQECFGKVLNKHFRWVANNLSKYVELVNWADLLFLNKASSKDLLRQNSHCNGGVKCRWPRHTTKAFSKWAAVSINKAALILVLIVWNLRQCWKHFKAFALDYSNNMFCKLRQTKWQSQNKTTALRMECKRT